MEFVNVTAAADPSASQTQLNRHAAQPFAEKTETRHVGFSKLPGALICYLLVNVTWGKKQSSESKCPELQAH